MLKNNIHEILRERLHQRAGLFPKSTPVGKTLKQLEQSEWSPTFEQLMRNRLLMGALRYGTLDEKRKMKVRYDLLGAMESKFKFYQQTGNLEYLVDIANYCLLEFELGNHPNRHFHALDNHHDHCKKLS